MGTATVYLGLGSNLGDRHQAIVQAIHLLSERIHARRVSSIYETEPAGYHDQPAFLNAVVEAGTYLEPEEILHFAKQIESYLGRMPTFRNGPRAIDIDVLLYDDRIVNTPLLTVPHPRLAERIFVLVPLAELAPDLVHPVSRKKVAELAQEAELKGIRRWKGEGKDVRSLGEARL